MAVIAAALLLAAWGDPPRTAKARLAEAARLKNAGDVAGALRIADAVIATEPKNAHAWNVRGWIRLGAGNLDDADADFAAALRLAPHYAAAAGNRGVVCERRSDQIGAGEWYDRALRAQPDDPEWLSFRGNLRMTQGRMDLARKDLEHATNVAPDHQPAWTRLGWLEQSESNWESALACYGRALKMRPLDAWTLSARARCLAEFGRLDAVLDDLDASSRANPSRDPSLVAFDAFSTLNRAEEVARAAGLVHGVPMRLRRAQVEAIRGLRFRADVPCVPVTSAELGAATAGAEETDDAAARTKARTRGLARLGLVRTSRDVAAARADARRAQASGYYDPSQRKFFVVAPAGGEPEDPSVVPHELLHALQDQHFSIEAFHRRSLARAADGVADEDLDLATRMVIEGEATLVQSLWSARRLGHGADEAHASVTTSATVRRAQDPLGVARMLISMAISSGKWSLERRRLAEAIEPYALVQEWAPYLQGMAFVERVWAKGGWGGVSALYQDPPRTTEQCLHPERFLDARDAPTPLAFPAVVPPADWTESDRRVLGELNVTLLLGIRGADAKSARSAGEGWDGDLLSTWTGPESRTAIVWATTWDTPGDARQFADAMRSVLSSRVPKAASIAETQDTVPAWTAVSYDCGDGPESRGRTVLRGREVFVVEGLPEAGVQAVVDALLRSEVAHVE